MLGSNQRPPPCRGGALPAELIVRESLNRSGRARAAMALSWTEVRKRVLSGVAGASVALALPVSAIAQGPVQDPIRTTPTTHVLGRPARDRHAHPRARALPPADDDRVHRRRALGGDAADLRAAAARVHRLPAGRARRRPAGDDGPPSCCARGGWVAAGARAPTTAASPTSCSPRAIQARCGRGHGVPDVHHRARARSRRSTSA